VRQAKSEESGWLRTGLTDKELKDCGTARNQAANGENKPQSKVSEEAGLLDSLFHFLEKKLLTRHF